ncbi:MAG TPA: translation initiation factor IF-2 [Candidatus Saccharimonadales bacterium]|nr:translation initiation factor IF-2 [Candidatus Saccharimonadales bacterium]
MARTIEIEDTITVGTLAEKLMLPVARLIGELMKNGVMVTVNERIDFDTAQIIVSELGLDVSLEKKAQEMPVPHQKKRAAGENASSRPPVVAVMGHVDHGKTSLLDAIRGAHVAKGEAGGITQHISAYQVTHNGRAITFLDTPGHAAFAAIREHGAHLTDIAIIVVAADDGVKPQTIEAIRFASTAGARIIVAINKIDKEGADSNRVKQQLSEQGLLVEEWGGDTVVVEVSAKTKKGIDELLNMILLVADVEDYRAETNTSAKGLIIEAHLEHGKGPIAHALIEEGMLHQGDYVVAGNTYAKVRTLENTDGNPLLGAGPSCPVVITGFKALPSFGDEFTVVATEKMARDQIVHQSSRSRSTSSSAVGMTSAELLRMINRSNQLQELKIIVRADVQGSLTSVVDSLRALDTEEVAVRVVSSGVGTITANDVQLAATSGSLVYGFSVTLPADIRRLAARDKVSIRMYDVIYELIDDVKAEMGKLLAPEVVETSLGTLVVRGIFKTSKAEIICGGEVTKGKLVLPALARITREGQRLAEVEITNLKRGIQDAKEILEGEMCGVSFRPIGKLTLQEGDRLEFFTRQTVVRSL